MPKRKNAAPKKATTARETQNAKKSSSPSEPKKSKKVENETSKYFNSETVPSDSSKAGGDVLANSLSDKIPSDSDRLPYKFFDVPCEDLAISLLGQKLVHVVDKKRLTGIIVETEAYLGPIDKGAHSFEGKRTAKNEAMFKPPGTAYVYNIYGLYCCMNISAKGKYCT